MCVLDKLKYLESYRIKIALFVKCYFGAKWFVAIGEFCPVVE